MPRSAKPSADQANRNRALVAHDLRRAADILFKIKQKSRIKNLDGTPIITPEVQGYLSQIVSGLMQMADSYSPAAEEEVETVVVVPPQRG